MSKDTFLSGCATCCKTWSGLGYRATWQRVKSVRLTSASGSSSWPSVTTRDHHSQGSGNNQKSPSLATTLEKNWPTIRASEYKDVGPVGSKSHDHMLGKHYLCAVVTQEESNWPTAQVTDSMGACLTEKRLCRPKGTQLREAVHGQAAPGEQQFAWEPPRVVDTASAGQQAQRDESNGQRREGFAGESSKLGNATHTNRRSRVSAEEAGAGPDDIWRRRSGESGEREIIKPMGFALLMGLPMGWVSPSCPASVIKNWPRFVTGWLQATTALTSCDSLETALCQPSQSEPSDFFLASCGKEPTK
jgi:hypothetical protein